MKLQTIIPVQLTEDNQIDYDSNIVLYGSCFAENLSKKFNFFKFKITIAHHFYFLMIN